MKPDLKQQEEKKLREIALEAKDLRHQIQNPPSVRLPEPIQRGWVRHYVLTKEAQLRPDAQVLGQILEVIGTKEYYWRRNFIKSRRQRPLIEIKQVLKPIHSYMWRHHPDKYPETWQPYFHLEFLQWWHGSYRYQQWVYVFTEAHLFELKVERHWLTHLKIIDPLLIERHAELEAWMEHHQGWRKYDRLKGRRHWWHNRDLNRKFEVQSKSDLRDFLSDPEEAEMKSPSWCLHFRFFLYPHVAQLEGGAPLRTETVRVQILSWGPFTPSSPTSRGAPLKKERLRVRIPPRGHFRSSSPIEEATDLRPV